MNFNNLSLEISDSILTITITRPKNLNALNKETLTELKEAVQYIYDNDTVHAAIITGEGQKAFVAGADISEFQSGSQTDGEILAAFGQSIFDSIEQAPKPIVAAVNGFALGGGCELAMACHLRIAASTAKFGQPEINLGLIPGYGGTQRLVQYIGKTKALELLLTADMISAPEAKELGLVNKVCPPEQLLDECRLLLKKITSKSPYAAERIIKATHAYFSNNKSGFEVEQKLFGECFVSSDKQEGVAAFIEKRKANFRK